MILKVLDAVPTWGMAVIVCGGAVLVTVVAQSVLHRAWAVESRRPLNEVTGFIIAVVGVVYAVLLASIAILTIERYDRAEETTQTEAGLVSDIYRDAVGMPEPMRSTMRGILTDYVDTVVDAEWPLLERNLAEDTPGWQDRGWDDLADLLGAMGTFEPATQGQQVFMQEILGRINDLNDARRLRMFAATLALDTVIWWVVVAGGIGTVAMVLLFGIPNSPGHLIISAILAFSISLVIVLIISMDRPFSGDPRVTAEPFLYVKERLANLAAP